MGRPLKLDSNSGGSAALKEMSDSEIYWAFTYPILKKFASEHSTGSLQTHTDGTYIDIGTFTDTYRIYNPGAHGFAEVADTATASVTLRQRNESLTESFIRPAEWTGSSLQEMSDADIDTYIINPTLTAYVNGDVGSYYMSPTDPGEGAGGSGQTWVSRITFYNKNSEDHAASTNTSIWQLTDKTSSAAEYALKVRTEGLQQISSDDTEELVDRFRNKIRDTGIGQYYIGSADTTASGTWIYRGVAFPDTLYNMANQNYSGSYTGSYSGNYASSFSTNFATSYALVYNGFVGTWYTGTWYTGYFTSYYTGTYSGTYTGTYTGNTVQETAGEIDETYRLQVRSA